MPRKARMTVTADVESRDATSIEGKGYHTPGVELSVTYDYDDGDSALKYLDQAYEDAKRQIRETLY